MNRKKMILNYLVFYVIGNVIFNIIFSIVKTIGINTIGGQESFTQNLLASLKETWIVYTLVFITIVAINEIYKKSTIHKLNQRLNQIKEGSEEDEK